MDFKLVNKKNLGIMTTLILVILLSQSRFFNFFSETVLGRMVLLAFIIMISYTSKFTGLLAVLFIIIAFRQYQYNTVHSYNFFEGFDPLTPASIPKSNVKSKEKKIKGKEGFAISDMEFNIIAGKQSNSIPTYNKSRQQEDDYVNPSDKSTFTSDFASV